MIKNVLQIYITLTGDKAERAERVKKGSKLSHPEIYLKGIEQVEKEQ